MKALVYKAVGKVELQDRPVPIITAPGDAIVKLTMSEAYPVFLSSLTPSRDLHQPTNHSRPQQPSAAPTCTSAKVTSQPAPWAAS
jgi:hypothetical protein